MKSLTDHKNEYHSETLMCEKCSKMFGSKEKMVHCHGIRNIKCQECDFCAKTKYDLKNDILAMHIELLTCEYCKKPFGLQSHLDLHVNLTHIYMKTFQCRKCIDTIVIQQLLEKHVRKKPLQIKTL